MNASHGAAPAGAAGTQTALPGTDVVLAELGSLYPIVAYWAVEEAGDEEQGRLGEEQQEEEFDEAIFAAVLTAR
jgi:hypothetical protein